MEQDVISETLCTCATGKFNLEAKRENNKRSRLIGVIMNFNLLER